MNNGIKISPKHGVNPTIPICFWCGKDKQEIALMGKIDKEDSEAPKHLIMDYEPCDACQELFDKGIHVIGVTDEQPIPNMFPIIQDEKVTLYPTGTMFVAQEHWVKKFLELNDAEDAFIERVITDKKLVLDTKVVEDIIADSKNEENEMEVSTENFNHESN